jgi:hypothetical protein
MKQSRKATNVKKNRALGAYVPDMGAWRNPETGAATKFGSEKFHRIYDRIYYYCMWVCCKQGCGSGSGSVLDPYSIGSLDPDPDPYSEYGSGSGSRRAKMTQKSRQ